MRPSNSLGEPDGPPGGVGRALALAGMQDLAGVRAGGQQGVQAQGVGVAVAGALLGVAVDLQDGEVGIHHQALGAGAGAGRPGGGQGVLGDLVELASVAEGEAAQSGPDGGERGDRMSKDPSGGPGAQDVDVVDAVGPGAHRVHHGQQLAAGVGRAGPVAQGDEPVGGGEAEPVGSELVPACVMMTTPESGGSHRFSARLDRQNMAEDLVGIPSAVRFLEFLVVPAVVQLGPWDA